MRLWLALLVNGILLVIAVIGASTALAEGSRTLFPNDFDCKPDSSGWAIPVENIEWRTNYYGDRGAGPGSHVSRRTLLWVYALAGEEILSGSSAVGVSSGGNFGDMLIDPGVITARSASTQPADGGPGLPVQHLPARPRRIFRRQDNHPRSGASGTSRIIRLCAVRLQGADHGRLWSRFWGPTGNNDGTDGRPTADIKLASSDNFDSDQGSSIAAWDVTVRAAGSMSDIDGRLFTYNWAAFTGGNGRPVFVTLYFVSKDGFKYEVQTRGLDPNGYAFYGNRQGFLDTDKTPLHNDIVAVQGPLNDIVGGVTLAPGGFPRSSSSNLRHKRLVRWVFRPILWCRRLATCPSQAIWTQFGARLVRAAQSTSRAQSPPRTRS